MADENISIGIDGNASGITGASSDASAAIKGTSSSAKDLAAAFRALQTSIDPTYAAQERYNKSLADNRALLAAGAISAQEFAAGNKAAAASLQANIAAIEANSEAGRAAAAAVKAARAQEAQDARDAAAAVRAAAADKAAAEKQAAADARAAQKAARDQERAEAAQAAAEDAAAVKQAKADERAASQAAAAQAKSDAKDARAAQVLANQAAKDAATASKQQAQAEAQLNAQLEMARAQLSPAYAAQLRYNQTMQQATQLLMNNRLEQGEFVKIQKQAQQQMEQNTRSLGKQNVGYIDLGYQVQDVVASFATGINPLVILAQQGGQTADAVRQMGGRFAGVASFISGPWGAALLGAVTVLGLLIPKLFDASTASDRLAQSQANLKEFFDETTGAIKAQTTALELRGVAANAQQVSQDQRKELDKGKNRAANMAQDAITDQYMSGGSLGSAGANLGSQITNPQTKAAIQSLNDALRSGQMQLEGYTDSISKLAEKDPQVRQLSNSLTTMLNKESKPGAGDSYAQLGIEIQKANAQAKLATQGADALSFAEKRLLGIQALAPGTTEASVKAQAELSVTTDEVTKAKDRQTIAEAKADAVRKKSLASAKNEADQETAEQVYIKSVAPYIAAVEKAQAAKEAARKAAAEGRKEENAAERAAAKEKEDDMKADVAEDDYQKQQAVDSYNDQVKWQNAKIAALKAFYGETSKQTIDAQRELEKMEQQHADKLRAIAMASIEARAKDQEAGINSQKAQAQAGTQIASGNLEAQHSIGAIDGRPYIEAKRAILEEDYQLEQEYAQKIYDLQMQTLEERLQTMQLAGKTESAEYASTLDQITSLSANFQAQQATAAAQQMQKQAAINNQVTENASQKWHVASDSITGSLNTAFDDIWTHQHKFGADMLALADNLVESYVSAGFKLLSNWLATEATKTTASLFGNRTRQAIAATGAAQDKVLSAGTAATHVANEAVKTAATAGAQVAQTAATTSGAVTRSAVNLTSDTAEITGRAATSAAGAFSSTVVIPFIGPVAAPVAAAAALAAVLGFTALLSAKGGLGEVPGDQLAMVHKKEMILPAWIAQPLRDSLKGAGPSGASSIIAGTSIAGADARAATHAGSNTSAFHYNPQYQGKDPSLRDMLKKDGAYFRKWVNNEVKNKRLGFGQ